MASSSCVVTDNTRLAALERAIAELTRGREIAGRLRHHLRRADADASDHSLDPSRTLVTQLLDNLSHSLSMLRHAADSDEASQAPPSAVKSEDPGHRRKTPAAKDRRGCYKRKRSWDTTVKDSPNLVEDGHAWRKYGQKAILNAKHPRNYFRCTHKFDQGCRASKQVQKLEDDPPLFRTTYHGSHTCTTQLKSAHGIIIDATSSDSSILWSFDGRQSKDTMKQQEEVVAMKPLQSDRAEADYYMSTELTAFDGDHLTAFSAGPDHGDVLSSDVYSCTASTGHDSGIDDMEAMVGSIEDFFEFGSLS